ncbi:MAG: GH1 family beta-glucosidase [Pelagimonas sp.]|uniref:GH1 family beta-glucosidase n=1 Tax=Pelagimonas sp. TaxID=2073170 RepID=UPI003D6A6E03
MTLNPLAKRFPANFKFGVATASFQIEGATKQGGRGPTIWDAFSHMPGRVYQGHTGNEACDHYNRWESDLDLIKSLNCDAYRFSIAWSRVLPEGRGRVNQEGLDFYDRLVDGLVARDISVFPTLYHWDLPLALTGYGGWTDRDTADAFAEYTSHVVRRLGDRIDALSTFNEPWCSSYLGHLIGKHAPGEKNIDAAMAATHVINLAHGKAVQAARAERADIQMGVVLNTISTYAASDHPDDVAAAERHFQFHNDIYLGPMFAGKYGDQFLDAYGDKLRMQDGDMNIIHQPLDWWGFNYYYPATVKHDPSPNAPFPASVAVPSTTSNVRTDIGWEIKSDGLTHLLNHVYDRYDMPPCYITENGACYNMGPDADGSVDDQPRLDYLNEHIGKVADALDNGIPMLGYFAWSLMDNFEWSEGYKMRFGIVHVDYETQVRTVKKSGKWYAALCAEHGAEVAPAE